MKQQPGSLIGVLTGAEGVLPQVFPAPHLIKGAILASPAQFIVRPSDLL